MKRREFMKMAGLGAVGLALPMRLGAAGDVMPIRTNILLFYPDQHRFDWTSMNRNLPDITPNLRRLAQDGINFTNAICPSPLCAPSRACLASGMEYERCGVDGNDDTYPVSKKTFYTMLKEAGYQVLGCGKFDLDKPAFSWGPDGRHKRDGQPSKLETWGFTDGCDNEGKIDGWTAHGKGKDGPYFSYLKKRGLVDPYQRNYKLIEHDYDGPGDFPEDAYGDNWIAGNGLGLLRSVPSGKPWFLQVNFNGPHDPMDITKPMYDKWKNEKFPPPADKPNTAANLKRRNYAAMINNIDHWLEIYLEEIRKRGELENTLVIYCSDHGEMLGDHGSWGKSKPLHPSSCVPLIISGPGIKKGVTCSDVVETLDLTATLLDYAGIQAPGGMDSKSLRPYLEGRDQLERKIARSALGGWVLLFDGRFKMISGDLKGKVVKADQDKKMVLYDLQEDPLETTDVASKHPDIVDKFIPLLRPASP